MKFAILSTLALATSALAFPLAGPTSPNAKFQKQIQTLEISIVKLINDLVQSSSNTSKDYQKALTQVANLAGTLAGPLPCGVGLPAPPPSKNAAIAYLQSATANLQQLSLDLQNPSLSISASSFHPAICSAADYIQVIKSQT